MSEKYYQLASIDSVLYGIPEFCPKCNDNLYLDGVDIAWCENGHTFYVPDEFKTVPTSNKEMEE